MAIYFANNHHAKLHRTMFKLTHSTKPAPPHLATVPHTLKETLHCRYKINCYSMHACHALLPLTAGGASLRVFPPAGAMVTSTTTASPVTRWQDPLPPVLQCSLWLAHTTALASTRHARKCNQETQTTQQQIPTQASGVHLQLKRSVQALISRNVQCYSLTGMGEISC